VAYQATREYDNAFADYRHAMALQPKEAVTHWNYVELLIFLRRIPEATEHARQFLTENPQSLLAKLAVERTLEAQKRYAEAYELISDVLPKLETSMSENELRGVPKDQLFAYTYSYYGLVAAALGKTDEASKAVNKAATYRNDFWVYYYRAKIHYIQGKWQQAVDELKTGDARSTREELDSSEGLESRFLLGNSYLKLGDMVQAKEAYEQFLAANKFEPEAFYNLGIVYAKLGNSRQAIERYSSALKLNPDLVAALTNRGSLYLQEEQYNDAIADFSAVLAKQPRDTEVLYKRAYSLCISGKQRLGKEDLSAILRIEPGNNRAKKLLSQC
jgi:tetratricopeptide (TPR) repeat protein